MGTQFLEKIVCTVEVVDGVREWVVKLFDVTKGFEGL